MLLEGFYGIPSASWGPDRLAFSRAAFDELSIALEQALKARSEPRISTAQRASRVRIEMKLLVSKIQAERRKDLEDPETVLAHPMWLRICAVLDDVLIGYPSARRELFTALAELGIALPQPTTRQLPHNENQEE